jgi:hypothetical protein
VNLVLSQEERRLRVFDTRVLRRIFELKKEEVTGGWRELFIGQLLNVYSERSNFKMIK